MARPTLRAAISHIDRHGALLVFPIKNAPNVPSLWKCFHPRTTMRWEWSEDGDDRVPALWHLREELSRSRKVAYVKWFRGRATLFSLELFSALLSISAGLPDPLLGLDEEARRLYRTLSDDSPLPTKTLRALAGFEGKQQESAFQKAVRALSFRLLILGYGEVEEGGFPSLALGCSKLLFEELWDRARALTATERTRIVDSYLGAANPFRSQYLRLERTVHTVVLESGMENIAPLSA